MMLAWKSAACLAAGNTLVLKPAQVTFRRASRDFKQDIALKQGSAIFCNARVKQHQNTEQEINREPA